MDVPKSYARYTDYALELKGAGRQFVIVLRSQLQVAIARLYQN